MNTIERRQHIIQQTEVSGKVSVKALAEQFNISTVSVRHDLNELNKLGLITRTRGGAIASNRLTKELSIKEKGKSNQSVKMRLGELAASFVQDNEAIIIDSGSTTEEIVPFLKDKKQLKVLTNGLNVVNQLQKLDNCEVLTAGGYLRRKSMSFYASDAAAQLRQYNFDKVILGVDGIDAKRGITTHFEPEAIFNNAMCNSADQVIVVTDSSKFNQFSLYSIIPLNKIDVLITDSGIPNEYLDLLEKMNISLYLVDK